MSQPELQNSKKRHARAIDYILASVIFAFIFLYAVTGKFPLQNLLLPQITAAQTQNLTPVTFYQDAPARTPEAPPPADSVYEEPAPVVTRHHSGGVPRNCDEARARGIAPIYSHEPEYGAHMDGDGDGIACEPYRGR
ncbi:MAG: excalibur calcium-binding domain-containing protein [Asticcacaulis sp.]